MAPPEINTTVHTPVGNVVPLSTRLDISSLIDFNEIYHQKTSERAGKEEAIKRAAAPVEVGHSGPQGKVVPLTIIDDPADWKAADLVGREAEYTYTFSKEDVAEIIAATEAILARGVSTEDDIKALTREDYHLPTVGPKLRKFANEVTNGRGFQLFRGFPLEHYKANRVGLVVAYWGFALHTGRPLVSQTDYKSDGSTFGSILNHITVGRWANVYKDNAYYARGDKKVDSDRLNFHSDQGAVDFLSMLCISAAKEGGESKLVSAIAIHNELLRRGRKDLVEVLSTPGIWYTAQKDDQARYKRNPDGSYAAFEETQPFEYHNGYLSVHFDANKFISTAKSLTPLQEEAIWAVAALAEDPAFHHTIKLQPGDIEWLHNPSTFHARTNVVDGENRHLIRWWVDGDANKRPIAPHYAPRSNVFADGGFRVPAGPELSKQRLPLYPYSRHDGLGQSHVE